MTERAQRTLLSAELQHGAIRAERLRATAEIPDLIVRIRERRTTNPAGAKVFLSERQGGGSGQRHCGHRKQGERRESKLHQSKHLDPPIGAPAKSEQA